MNDEHDNGIYGNIKARIVAPLDPETSAVPVTVKGAANIKVAGTVPVTVESPVTLAGTPKVELTPSSVTQSILSSGKLRDEIATTVNTWAVASGHDELTRYVRVRLVGSGPWIIRRAEADGPDVYRVRGYKSEIDAFELVDSRNKHLGWLALNFVAGIIDHE